MSTTVLKGKALKAALTLHAGVFAALASDLRTAKPSNRRTLHKLQERAAAAADALSETLHPTGGPNAS